MGCVDLSFFEENPYSGMRALCVGGVGTLRFLKKIPIEVGPCVGCGDFEIFQKIPYRGVGALCVGCGDF